MKTLRPHPIALLLLVAAALHAHVAVAQNDASVTIGQRSVVRSEVLGEDRPVIVYLPETYDREAFKEKSYPVLYLLDGAAYFNATVGIVHHLSARSAAVGRIPELIVVAIANTKRTRDLTPSHVSGGLYSENSGGSAAFRRFLSDELIPEIESRYRASEERILVGHSLGGLFAVDSFLEQPDLFDRYIATDPSLSWDAGLEARKLAREDRAQPKKLLRVFVAQASNAATDADSRAHVAAIANFKRDMQSANPLVEFSYEYFEDETHLSVPLVAIYRGLLAVYADHYDAAR